MEKTYTPEKIKKQSLTKLKTERKKNKIAWQKERKRCAYCQKVRYRQFLKSEIYEGRKIWVCQNEDKCAIESAKN